ncbi:Calcineurin-like phosphoesterase [Oryzisolibacter propanilivorax]|uniref:Calcineurin-like phosphoesterase n=1 Tax=Oryzisolibacter propanilivorax TaxID=1527607 RepID=A0A1G9S7W5_9BURK|nr:metallophosphoesterase [Oryzisolibacter propanilivorax]SDM31544.1 Calcineurin-like phosphoesterase [Oryzisolibacter propanilivorax]
MRLHILSDLHLSVQGLEHPHTDADVVVLAGDIARPAAAIDWARGLGKPVLYVPGNHEFYGSSLGRTRALLHALSAGTPVQVLDNRSTVLGGARFVGSTLWTDFCAAGLGPARDEALAQAQRFMRDFSRIQDDGAPAQEDGTPALFTPEASAALFAANAQWLRQACAEPFDGPTVVVTHHAPSLRSIHPRFAGSPLNACFVSDAEALVADCGAPLWIHGHTHDSFDYRVGGTRVLCNPRGYAPGGVIENAQFDPCLAVDVPAGGHA